MKLKKFIVFALLLIVTFSVFSFNTVSATSELEVYVGGMSIGLNIKTRGAYVVGLGDVLSDKGIVSPAKNANVEVGDVLLKIDGVEINSILSVERMIEDGHNKMLTLRRNGEIVTEMIKPIKDVGGVYRLGLFLRDTVNGIGTVTYAHNNILASLGHPVLDENGEILDIQGGNMCKSMITGVTEGKRGTAGALHGSIYQDGIVASIKKISEYGVFAKIDDKDIKELKMFKMPVGKATVGDAKIFTTVEGNRMDEYSISIIKSDLGIESNKNLVIKITDKNLLDKTGGIVQGMSGSPIIQDGKLVGAVTHVFINDPTRGFGISIDNMLNNQ